MNKDHHSVILQLLEKHTGSPEVHKNLDIALFEEALLDSFGLVQLILAISDELRVPLTLGEVERAAWATPRKIIEFLDSRAS